ncbi:hypothetical protein [Chromobacterium violaceum]|uniref:hypothetical protein n=1 Tax=Chromobacterium violaceum TaxID=536 RepID=UPI001FD2DBEB|nr:hypothetical protein [Chromobacterium violaceum]
MAFQGAGFDDPAIVDGAAQDAVVGACGHDDLAAVGLNQLLIFGEVVQGAFIDLDADQLVVGEAYGDLAAAG